MEKYSTSMMDVIEATRIMYDRIQQIELDNVLKIIGYVLMRDNGEHEMIKTSWFAGHHHPVSLIMEAKAELGLSHPIDMVADEALGSHFCQKPHWSISSTPPQFPVKICHYHLKGFCKHGSNCRYFHGTPQQQFSLFPNSSPTMEDHGIPCQQKRMFGFETFVFAETAKLIHAQGNPHSICGKYAEKVHSIARYNQRLMERDAETLKLPDASRFLGDDLFEEPEYALDLDRRRLEGLQIAPQSLPWSHFGCLSDHLYPSEG
ncbi:hypothetical protein SAY86_022707 [Trapa natans]|uniref:C3H1-type domain-containing protein n=1 Tax=Trapa natans TaxID=22666 RepID=A0AAN7R786_TRANT|nr:hypothetical protein SAY86_022707 [Trapa natans]